MNQQRVSRREDRYFYLDFDRKYPLLGIVIGRYYIWPFNYLIKDSRYTGYKRIEYDYPVYTIGFHWFNIGIDPHFRTYYKEDTQEYLNIDALHK